MITPNCRLFAGRNMDEFVIVERYYPDNHWSIIALLHQSQDKPI